jgi:hypothetical protein
MARYLRLAFMLAVVPAVMRAAFELGPIREVGPGITPALCVDPNGVLHIVSMHAGAIEHRRVSADGVISAPERVPAPPGSVRTNSPHLAVDAAGTLHLAFTHDASGNSKQVWYAARRDGRWSAPMVAIDSSGTEKRTNYPRLAVAGDQVLIAAFVGGGSRLVKLGALASAPRVVATADSPLWVAHPLIDPTGEYLVVGRHGASGHKLQRFTPELRPAGEPLLLSRDTPTKTYEATAAIIDARGVVHAAGAAGQHTQVLWYSTSERAEAGQGAVLGPELGQDIKEYSYPVLLRDTRGRIYVSYRHHPGGEGCITALDASGGRFEAPVTIAPMVERRLRWNPHLAAAPRGGVFTVWDNGGRVYLRSVDVALAR